MRRTLQWVRGFFGTSTKKSQPATTSQLGHADKETSDPIFLAVDEVSGSLQEGLLSWLLNVEPHQLEKTDERTSAIVAQLESRISSGKLEELPRQPLILPKLLQALSKENSDRRELVSIILKDPALTNRVLQVANSPFFRSGDQHIESVDQAVFLLGHRGIRNVVSASIMQPMLAARDNAETLFSERVWQWGMTCARSAEAVAISKGVDSGAHFLLGLLPALSYITLRREVQRLYKDRCNREEVPPQSVSCGFQPVRLGNRPTGGPEVELTLQLPSQFACNDASNADAVFYPAPRWNYAGYPRGIASRQSPHSDRRGTSSSSAAGRAAVRQDTWRDCGDA